ncbi:MAG: energy transducer TonB [Gammaproteobacteria bacterium]|nr:energy transducer TonB [Gammaproteobacteria bacterium]
MSMNNPTINPVAVTQSDRMSLTIFFALAIHAILILGISFDLMDSNDDIITTMEITLVHQRSTEEPEEADYLAQANQLGGGTQQSKSRPSSPFSNPLPIPEKGFAPNSRRAMTPPHFKEAQKQTEIMSVDQSNQRINNQQFKEETPVSTKSLTAAQLFERSQQIAKLSAEINKLKEAYQQTPKHTWVHGANAKKYRFASYMDAWRAKVERIGNLNYPQLVTRNKITGSLLLDVAINPDGSIHSARITRSSGYPELDQAALRIVNMAAPFPPLTKDILKDTDVLHIPRVWRFQQGSRLQTSNQ